MYDHNMKRKYEKPDVDDMLHQLETLGDDIIARLDQASEVGIRLGCAELTDEECERYSRASNLIFGTARRLVDALER